MGDEMLLSKEVIRGVQKSQIEILEQIGDGENEGNG